MVFLHRNGDRWLGFHGRARNFPWPLCRYKGLSGSSLPGSATLVGRWAMPCIGYCRGNAIRRTSSFDSSHVARIFANHWSSLYWSVIGRWLSRWREGGGVFLAVGSNDHSTLSNQSNSTTYYYALVARDNSVIWHGEVKTAPPLGERTNFKLQQSLF